VKLLFFSNLFPDRSEPLRGLDNATLLHQLAPRWEIRALALRPSLPFAFAKRIARTDDQPFDPQFWPVPYIPKIGSRANHWLAARALRKPLKALRRQFAFDVVLGSWIYPDCCALAMLAEELGFVFLAIAQGSDVHQYLRMPARRKAICRWLPGASAIITRSAELAKLLAEAGLAKEKLHPIYNGINFERFKSADPLEARRALNLPLEAPIILAVGNLLPIKNPLLLVEAHAELCQWPAFAKTQLVFVGSGPLGAEIRARADAGGHGAQVLLAGRQEAETVARYMQAASILCLPSNNEGVPNVILEAFACGLPVVASRVGGLPEVHTHEFLGRLTPPGDASALRDALRDILSRPVDHAQIEEHARQFSWARTAAAYEALLTKAAKALR
jgi:glycosyltransferase involved in cell wall biosynthesis